MRSTAVLEERRNTEPAKAGERSGFTLGEMIDLLNAGVTMETSPRATSTRFIALGRVGCPVWHVRWRNIAITLMTRKKKVAVAELRFVPSYWNVGTLFL